MAAYGALVSLMNDLELIPNHPTHSFSFDNKQISSLSQTVHCLMDFMETFDSHDYSRESTQILESLIASAAHSAHDVIESHLVDQIHAGSTLDGKSRSYFLLDLQKVTDDMDFVKRKAMMQLEMKSEMRAEPTSSESHNSGKNLTVGFDDAVVRFIEILIGEPSSKRVIPIVGMGGIGKTTLSRNVYDHLLIQHHFDVCVWATISHEYNIGTVLTELLFGERKSTIDGNVNELGEGLHKKLWGRRYLVVLDDMWSVEAWDEIQLFLPDNGNGSRVIVTTRLSNLASRLSPSPFEMNFLDDDKSWELFCRNAFGEGDCPFQLEEIGKKIVKRCRGLPLSIVVIGGHFRRSSSSIEYWEKFASFMNPISSLGIEDQCLKIISLSYDHLPPCLKPCFLYTKIFHEDEWFYASELLQFWIAEGFIKPNKSLSLEEVAEDYLNDLIDRNLILAHIRRWNGKVEYCGVHDLVRELCLKVAKKEKFMCVLEEREGISSERRVVIREGKKLNPDMIGALESTPMLRSIIRRGGHFNFDDELRVNSRLLRLYAFVNNTVLKENGPKLSQVNLRYLAFSCQRPTVTTTLPSFWSLQTLVINSIGVVITAPREIWEMPQLRNLELVGVSLPDPLPERIVLRNLHRLIGVVNLRLTEEVCERMPNIKKLVARYNRFPGDCEASSYYCPHNLGRFTKLESLTCYFGISPKWRDIVLRFEFPTFIEELCLWNCHLDWEDLTMMIKSLAHLGSLQLNSVRGLEWDLVDEEFHHLKKLTISNCDDLVCWNANSSHFPVLESLHVWTMPKLNEIPFDFGEIPTLKRIKLHRCSMSAAVSAMRIVVEQESLGNQELQLDVNFWKMEEVERFQEMVEEESLRSNSLRVFIGTTRIRPF